MKIKRVWGLGWIAAVLAVSSVGRAAPEPVRESVFRPKFDFSQADWERTTGEDQDIQVYRWKAPGKDLFAFKGHGVVNAPLPKIAGIIADTKRQHEWLPDLGEARVVDRISPLERIQYVHFETPFVVKDRDFVIGSKASFDPASKIMDLEFASIEDARVPPTDKVRGEILRGHYRLVPLAADRTEVTIEVYLDPKGSVPRWMVNATQSGFPRRTLDAMREQAAKTDVKEHPLVRAAVDGKVSTPAEMDAYLKANPDIELF